MKQVTIIDQTREIDAALLHAAAVALNQQVSVDLPSIWAGVSAGVSVAPSVHALTPGAWPVFLVKKLPPGEGGYHLDKNNQPYAKVIASATDDSWTIDASHEIIEMLVDPFGNRMHSSQGITINSGDTDVIDGPGVFNYLVEACDPCEANNYGYQIDGILVSDFITPNFYDATVTPGTSYSFKGNITRPRQLLPGGYISYQNADSQWQQILWVDPNTGPQYNNLSATSGVRSLREELHRQMGAKLDEEKHDRRRQAAAGSPASPPNAWRELREKRSRDQQLIERYELQTSVQTEDVSG
jgi:hypothetical protein